MPGRRKSLTKGAIAVAPGKRERPSRCCSLFVSVLVAGIVQNQLAVAFGTDEEYIAVMMLLVLIAVVATMAFGIALVRSRSVAVIDGLRW